MRRWIVILVVALLAVMAFVYWQRQVHGPGHEHGGTTMPGKEHGGKEHGGTSTP